MSNSVLSSFDPLATHPFTNNSGLLPKPAAPSQYPHPHPSPSKALPSSNGVSQGPIILATAPVHAPQPKRASAPKSSSSGPKPIFVPFRPERSSPELEDILLKKKFVDAFQGKGTWGIDSVPLPSAVPSAGKQGKAHIYTSCYCEENIYLLAQTFTQLSESNATERRGPWPWQIFVVFISNGGKTVALWNQKAARDSDTGVVVWDYHVVLVLLPVSVPVSVPRRDGGAPHASLGRGEGGGEAWVYDFDTTLVPVPCPWRDYVAGTFPYAFDRRLADQIDERFHSLFRVIPADVYLDHFASDRSHMDEADEAIPEGPRYSMPPPPYPPLRGTKARALGVTNNLMASFVSMSLSHLPSALSKTLAEGYGQVMDLDGFVAWLAGPSGSEKAV
ncbi:N-terminal glutamine amidase-domain-containing protein [Cubamyces menziesii]|nr:N-terminal glutamine amidase-domain-containing protein [Cubamyces menziesii]